MASRDCGDVGMDALLRHIDNEADSVSIEVTLYMPWGVVTGITVPNTYFGHYVSNFFARNDAHDVAGRLGALQAEQARVFLHLRKARCYVAGTTVEHDSLRIGFPMCPHGPLPASPNPQPRRWRCPAPIGATAGESIGNAPTVAAGVRSTSAPPPPGVAVRCNASSAGAVIHRICEGRRSDATGCG
jgi:hypothetical protein